MKVKFNDHQARNITSAAKTANVTTDEFINHAIGTYIIITTLTGEDFQRILSILNRHSKNLMDDFIRQGKLL